MKTLSLKIPETLDGSLTALAERKGVTKSALIREVLTKLFRKHPAPVRGSALALAKDLVGCVEGPEDLASNPAYLADLGY